MDEKQLSLRLEKASNYVPENSKLADIGSDHAYLPCALVYQKKIDFAIAGEVVEGPFFTAKEQVNRLGFQSKIEVRLGNGLEVLKSNDHITAITICGMGGTLIASILEDGFQNGKLSGEERLILQPNIGEENVRKWLMEHNYQIIAEELLEEETKLYEIIVAEKKEEKQNYNHLELRFGLELNKKYPELFIKKWKRQLEKDYRVLASLEAATSNQQEKITLFKTKIAEIEELIR